MTRQERWVLIVVLLLVFSGLMVRAWWRIRPPVSLPPVPVSADPGTQYHTNP